MMVTPEEESDSDVRVKVLMLELTDILLVVALGFIVRNADLGGSGSEHGTKASTLEECGCKLKPCAHTGLEFAARLLQRITQGLSLQPDSSSVSHRA